MDCRAALTSMLWLTEEPAWPTLRGHLLQLATTGIDPVMALREATFRQPEAPLLCCACLAR